MASESLTLERRAARSAWFADAAEKLKREAEAFGELEPGDIRQYKRQAASFRRQAARLRANRAQAPRRMARRREPRRQSVRSGPRRARASGRSADDEPEPVARLGGFVPRVRAWFSTLNSGARRRLPDERARYETHGVRRVRRAA
jgi:hypothetical protein